jgi:hypothetical protein
VAAPDRHREVVRERGDRDHEREVEEQLELARRAVRLVGRPGEHPDADLQAHKKHRPDGPAVCDSRPRVSQTLGLSGHGG